MPRFNPPAPPTTGPIIRLSVQALMQAQTYECILDYMASAPLAVTPTVQLAFIAAWRAALENDWRGVMSSFATIQAYVASEVVSNLVPASTVGGLALPGTVVQPSMPGTVAVVSMKGSILKGQHGRGRVFFYAVPTTFITPLVDPNSLNALGIATYLTLTNALVLPINAAGAVWQLSVSTRPIAPLTSVIQAIPVSSMSTNPILATVRRRREGRGI